ncbi:serine hydrolase [Vitiosangium sp. GDMCC 1.1324]|uniref:serine hydrolase n=1 Tax=Vitiosangium sp. (strain GDMCC 1.1324) TaxID=2138576 RepID=UPI001E45877B|nr:serine hydrolase [Vitiosangium sp. GDMCC 1.1324]
MRLLPLCLALLLATAATAASPTLSPTRSRALETELLRAVREVGFDQVRDWRHRGERIRHMPNVDVAVIELDAEGRPVAAANVLVSRDHPKGRAVAIDGETLGARTVRFTKWDLDRWDDKKGWSDAPAGDDLAPGREQAPLRFMAPYPASLFKILIAYRVMKLVDRGELTLDTPYRFLRDTVDKGERPLRGWLEPMIVESDNGSTEALVKLLHERGAMEGLNAEYAALGLETLQVNGTSPVTGRNWQPGSIHMTALDTAKLFLLINGGPGVLWRTREGRAVTAAELSEPARGFLKKLLADQGYAEGLSSTLVCGDPNVRPGIPTAVPARWLAADGTATVGTTAFKRDTRPCNAAAEVEFLHKTGQTENYGSDAGIVRTLPGKEPRHYVIAFLSNLGYRYYDEGVAGTADFEDEENGFPGTVTAIGFTQSIAELGRRVDETLKQRGLVKR